MEKKEYQTSEEKGQEMGKGCQCVQIQWRWCLGVPIKRHALNEVGQGSKPVDLTQCKDQIIHQSVGPG